MDTVTLKEHFDDLRTADQLAIAAALASAEKAVGVAETNAEKWRDSANEWRSAMNDRERQFLTRKEFYAMITTAIVVMSFVFAFKR
jgi:hypothetical protein